VNSTAPDKGVGLQLTIPIRNRASQALQIRSELEYNQAKLRQQQLENQISIEVRNAQFGVEQNRASVASAQAAVDYAKQSLDAEQKKYQFGTSTTTLVLQNQSGLATAESTLMSAMAAYEKSRIELDRAIGVTLDNAGISIDDAARGQVSRLPNIPHVTPRKELPTSDPAQTGLTPEAPKQ
jgi:outer membrane protein TolC